MALLFPLMMKGQIDQFLFPSTIFSVSNFQFSTENEFRSLQTENTQIKENLEEFLTSNDYYRIQTST